VKTTLCLLAIALLVCSAAIAQDHPRAETFFGYTYMRMNSATNVPAFSANGGSGQFAINANKWLGFVADIGSVHNGNISDVHLDTTLTNFLFGPRVSLRYSRVIPYFNILFGGVYGSTSASTQAIPVASPLPVYPPGNTPIVPGQPVTLRASASQTAFAMATGGGLDIKINRHVSFRPIGLDYFLTRLQNLRSAEDNNQHNLRYTAGFNFTFGGEAPAPPPPPPPPPTKSCWDGSSIPVDQDCPKRSMSLGLTASAAEVCPGGVVNITPPAGLPQNAVYQWTIQGQPVSRGPSLEFGTAGRDPGTYKVGLSVTAPDYNDATAGTAVTVRGYGPPTGTLQVSPAEIWAGQPANLAANFTPGQCGGDLGPVAYKPSEGAVNGNQFDSAGVQFDPASNSEQRKTVRIVAQVSDGKGSGTAEATLVVKKPAVLVARRLPDIVFPNANARVNNCGKRVLLEELKSLMQMDPGGKVVLVGHVSEKEAGKSGLDQRRALNAAAVVSAGAGICYAFPASQVLVGAAGAEDNGVDFQSHFCGTTNELPGSLVKESESDAKYRRVEVWFVPAGGEPPASTKNYQDAASLSVAGLGCPK
jgi:hypothetical protein